MDMQHASPTYLSLEPQVRRLVESLRGKQLIIYGGGKIGTRICRALRFYGIRPHQIWDIRHEMIREVDGVEVVAPAPESLAGNPHAVAIVTVYSENVCRAIAAELRQRGVAQVIFRRTLLNALLYLECHHLTVEGRFVFDRDHCHLCPVPKELRLRCDIYSRHIAAVAHGVAPHVLGLPGDASQKDAPQDEPFVIPSLGVLVTNHCNLTCQGCNHLRDHYRPEDNVTLQADAVVRDVEKVAQAVDLIEKVVVVGGEAFVHRKIDDILERLLGLPRIGLVQVITNGTIIPRQRRVFGVLANPRVMVEISGYGDHLPVPLQQKVQEFLTLLKAHGIRHRHLETLEWQDFGDFRHRGYSEKRHRAVYKTCCFVSHDLFDGRLFKCSRSVFATRLGLTPEYPGDYVDVRREPAESLRARLAAFMEFDCPEACQHCNGTSPHRVPAGVQVPKASLPRDAAAQEDVPARDLVVLTGLAGTPLPLAPNS